MDTVLSVESASMNNDTLSSFWEKDGFNEEEIQILLQKHMNEYEN